MKAWELLSDASKWTQGEPARDIHGRPVDADDSEAVCWCLMGALNKCYPGIHIKGLLLTRNITQGGCLQEFSVDVPHEWNDDPVRTFEDVHNFLQQYDI